MVGGLNGKVTRLPLLAAALTFAAAAYAQPINIEAGHFEMLLAENKATYTGGVVAVQGDREIRADHLTVYFNEDNDVVSMLAEGDPATLSDQAAEPAITVTGAALDYHFDEQRVRVSGGGALVQGEDRLTAEIIIYDLEAERAEAFSNSGGRVQLTLEPKQGGEPR